MLTPAQGRKAGQGSEHQLFETVFKMKAEAVIDTKILFFKGNWFDISFNFDLKGLIFLRYWGIGNDILLQWAKEVMEKYKEHWKVEFVDAKLAWTFSDID